MYMLFFFATLNSSCPSPIFQYIYSRRPTKCAFSVSNLSSWEYLFPWFIIIQKGFSTFPLFMTLICDCWLNGLDITLHCLAHPPTYSILFEDIIYIQGTLNLQPCIDLPGNVVCHRIGSASKIRNGSIQFLKLEIQVL